MAAGDLETPPSRTLALASVEVVVIVEALEVRRRRWRRFLAGGWRQVVTRRLWRVAVGIALDL